MIKKIIILIHLIFLSSILSAQKLVDGFVLSNSNKQPLQNAVITITNLKNDIIEYKLTDNNGFFVLSYSSELQKDSLYLNISLLGYENKRICVSKLSPKQKINLVEAEIELKEVKISPPIIWQKNDTLVYDVIQFKSKGDRNIGSILKKIPGIEVSSGGGIKYHGTPINKFYIEGLDLLEGKYNIATNNVPADAVTNIEVLENHQPIKNIAGTIFSKQAAINLKLNKNKIQHPIGNTDIGTGVDEHNLLCQLDIFGLQMKKNNQTIITYKTNNTGINISSELIEHQLTIDGLLNGNKSISENLVDATSFNRPPLLSENRYTFNKTHVLSINNLWKVTNNNQIRINLNYMNDREDETIKQNNTYYLGDSVLSINEHDILYNRKNFVDGLFTFINNSEKFYLKNALKFQAKWDNTISNISLQDEIVRQHFRTPVHFIQNDLTFYKVLGKHIINFSSYSRYSSLPQQLKVDKDSIDGYATQNISKKGFYSNNNISFLFSKGYSKLSLKLNLEANIENLKSDLNHILFNDSTDNRLKSDYLNVTFSPNYNYSKNRFQLDFALPITQHSLWIYDDQFDKKEKYKKLYLSPSLQLRYKLNPLLEVYANYQFDKDIGDIMNFTQSYTMTNYRNFQTSSGILSKVKKDSYTIGLNYKNHVTALFFNTKLSYITSKKNLISSQNFDGITAFINRIPVDNYQKRWYWRNYIGKYITSLTTNISLSAGYSLSRSEKLQQSYKYPLRSSIVQLQPKIDSKITDMFSITYLGEILYNNMKIKTNGLNNKSSFFQLDQILKFNYYPSDKFIINFLFEYLYNDITNTSFNYYFADMGFTYQINQFEFSIAFKNIFNRKSYSYIIYNDLDTFSYNYRLRPASVIGNFTFKF